MINILIVDDSATETAILKSIFESAPDFRVVGCAKNGKEAIEMAEKLKPNLITMDIIMPVMDGLEATRYIMTHNPTPIIVISSKLNTDEINTTFLALDAGALSVLSKPYDIASSNFPATQKKILSIIRAMSDIKVIRKLSFGKHNYSNSIKASTQKKKAYEVITLGSSIGGPRVLNMILSSLPADFSVPILIVQHMTSGFVEGFAKWLNDHTKLRVKVVENGEILEKGTVYFAPDHYHFEIARSNGKLIANLNNESSVDGFCPSITVLLKSVAKICGENAVGAILTGMGSDGAEGLLALKKAHGHTLIQDEKSCVVFGMASVAQSLGAVDKVVEIDKFADYLLQLIMLS